MLERIEFNVGPMHGVEYKQNGLKHKTNGPAVIIEENCFTIWYLFDKKHRYYGVCNTSDWYIHGNNLK